MLTLKEYLDDITKHLKFNKQLASQIHKFQVDFINKNQEHMEFFGGNLTGVNIVRFTDKDLNEFFHIIKVDQEQLRKFIVSKDAYERQHGKTPTINADFFHSSNPFNIICFYLAHKFLNSNLLDKKQREIAALFPILIMQYKWMTSLLAIYFQFPCTKNDALTTYANLTNRYLIKKLENWQTVFEHRANEVIGENGLYRNIALYFNDEYGLVLAINGAQGAIKDLLKNIYKVHIDTLAAGNRIQNNKAIIIDAEGRSVLADKTTGSVVYIDYINQIISDKNSFIQKDLTDISIKLIRTSHPDAFIQTLYWCSENILSEHRNDILRLVKLVLVYAIDYLYKNNISIKMKNIDEVLVRLRGLFLSSRSDDPQLKEMRDIGNNIVKIATNRATDAVIASIRTTLFIYICLKAFTKNHNNE